MTNYQYKIRYPIVIILTCLCMVSLANTLTVKQDGTGDYIIISNAVEAAVDGDTVLVWPGIYYENIYCENKNITIGSLTLTTGDLSYIQQTIIDGNKTGSCFNIQDCQLLIEINGFTLTNGSGTWHGSVSGGAIIVKYSNMDIYNCEITNNHAQGYGGGIYYYHSTGYLSSLTIKNNHSYKRGGGILLLSSNVEFDTVNKCNIYLNYSAIGTDIYRMGDYPLLHLVVDTFTVESPDYYYMYSQGSMGYPNNDITFEINTGKVQPATGDLFVSPVGNNQNSGLTPDEPLKDISFALLKMASDSISPDTIHVANGVYTLSGGERFPLSLKRDISILGQNRDSTILDAEDQIYLMHGIFFANNYNISNLTIQHGNGDVISPYGYGGILLQLNNNSSLTNILFKENYGTTSGGGSISTSNNFVLDKIDLVNNIGGGAIRVGYGSLVEPADTVIINNCRVIENFPDYSIPDMAAGGGISVLGQTSSPNHITCIMYNCLFIDNEGQDINNGAGATALSVTNAGEAYLVNSTIADNTTDCYEAAGIGVTYGAGLHIYNSIIYNNEYGPAYMYTQDWAGECNLNIYNSLVDGGESAIQIYSPFNNLYYDETNIDTDPLFYGGWEYPYNLSDNSPCINTGTLDLPDWIELPETDLAGNPRVFNDAIDMGAYEWDPTVGFNEYLPIKKEKQSLLKAAPNPFSNRTIITATFKSKSNIKLEVYNNYGQRVKVFLDATTLPGVSHIVWNGDDDNNHQLPTGVYYVVMFENGKEVESLKLIMNK